MSWWSRKAPFRSTEECFEAARMLMARLEARSQRQAAAELREGFAGLNGLTDGWALFLASIENVQTAFGVRLDPDDREALAALREAAHAAVHRR